MSIKKVIVRIQKKINKSMFSDLGEIINTTDSMYFQRQLNKVSGLILSFR